MKSAVGQEVGCSRKYNVLSVISHALSRGTSWLVELFIVIFLVRGVQCVCNFGRGLRPKHSNPT